MKKIDLMIVGAQKAATTSLKNYLGEHPDIKTHIQTEFSYFIEDAEYSQTYESVYKRYFGEEIQGKVVAKSAVMYVYEKALSRLLAHNKECHLLYLLREPVDRAYSAYTMEVSNGWMKRDFRETVDAIAKEEYEDIMYRLFIQFGLYADYLETIYKYFPRQNVHIVLLENLKKYPNKICSDIFKVLEVDKTFTPNHGAIHNSTKQSKSPLLTSLIMNLRKEGNIAKRTAKAILPYSTFTKIGYQISSFNKSASKYEKLDESVRSELKKFFRPHNDRLMQMTGLDLAHWNE